MNKDLVGITEYSDPTIDLSWQSWVGEGKPAILITKRPDLLYPLLSGKESIVVHSTITGLGGTIYEPNIPSYDYELGYYHRLCDLMGKERVVLRLDPIIKQEVSLLRRILNESEGRSFISFLDFYPKTRKCFVEKGIKLEQDNIHLLLEKRLSIWKELDKPSTCFEPEMSMRPCILEDDFRVLGINPVIVAKKKKFVCDCIANKVELCKNLNCTYNCLYCFWGK